VHKVETQLKLKRVADELFEETDLLLAQKFLPTEFDWRIGVLAGEPLFVCQYRLKGVYARLATGYGARPLADRQAPRRRLRPRGWLPHLRTRAGPARADRHA
jgi:hypothetical protein